MAGPSLEVYFVRHGETTNNILHDEYRKRYGHDSCKPFFEQVRVADAPLTERGVQQCQLVAARLVKEVPSPSAIWCSFLDRALHTAFHVQRLYEEQNKQTIPVEVHQDLHETGGLYLTAEDGQHRGLSGKRRADVVAQFPTFAVHPKNMIQRFGVSACGVSAESCEETACDAMGWWSESMGKETDDHAVKRADYLLGLLAERCKTVSEKKKPAVEGASTEGGLEGDVHASSDVVLIITHGDYYNHIMHRMDQTVKRLSFGENEQARPTNEPAESGESATHVQLPQFKQFVGMRNVAITKLRLAYNNNLGSANAQDEMGKDNLNCNARNEGEGTTSPSDEVAPSSSPTTTWTRRITAFDRSPSTVHPLLRTGEVSMQLVLENCDAHTRGTVGALDSGY